MYELQEYLDKAMLDNANSFRENIFNKQVRFEFNVINYDCFV